MAALFKRKGGNIWHVDYYMHGKRYKRSTRTSDRELAELALKDIEVKIARDELDFNRGKAKTFLSEFTGRYLRFSKATKEYNTYCIEERVLRRLKESLGDIWLSRITAEQIEAYKIERLQYIKPISVNLELRHLKAAFEKAIKWGYIKSNPFKEVDFLKVKDSNFPKFFNRAEVNLLLQAIPDGTFKNLIIFYLYTGCRRNEALNLTWDDIDLNTNRVTFLKTKSGKSRMVPFNGKLYHVLKSMKRNGEKPFPFRPHFVTHEFKKFLRASEVSKREVLHLHSLRHTYASHLVMAGVDLCTVGKLLGHSSVKVTEKYAHLAPDHLQAVVERLNY